MAPRWLGYAVVGLLVLTAGVYGGLASGAFAPYLGGYDPPPNETATDGAPTATPTSSTGTTQLWADDYEHATVTVQAANGTTLATVEAAVADTFRLRYVGLSNTDDLPADRGMLFVHDEPDRRTYVMRNMSFGIDIVFVAANGTITEIHHAPAPGPDEDGSEQRYRGHGQYVLEVNYEWTAEHGVAAGDEIVIDRE